jgi:outer membrane protein, multidrug efflux system
VEDALIANRKIGEQQAAQDRQIQAFRRTLRLANLRYDNGYSNYLEVLDVQRNLFNAELQQVQLQRTARRRRRSLQSSGRRMGTVTAANTASAGKSISGQLLPINGDTQKVS